MTNQTLNEEATPVASPPKAPSKTPNKIGLIALILAALGFILAVIPPAAGFAWLLTLPALILGIIGLTRKGQKKATSIIAMILATVAWIIAVIVALSFVAAGVSDAIDKADKAPAVTEVDGDAAPAESAKEAAIGDTVTTENGVDFSVTGMECGLATAGEDFLEEKASGQFCAVSFTVNNKGADALDFMSSSLTGYIADAKYDAEVTIGNFGDDSTLFATLNPGLSAKGLMYFDVPAPLELVKFTDQLVFGDEVAVSVK